MELDFQKFDYKNSLDEQREVFSLCFPETINTHQESIEHYLWKFHSFPHSPPSYEYMVEEDKKMLGYYAAIPYKYVINGQEMVAGMVCDVMTHPQARGKGIFTRIGNYATNDLKEQGIHFTTGYPIRPEVIPGHMKVGWDQAFALPIFMKILKSNSVLKSKNIGFLSPFVNIGLSIYEFFLSTFFVKSNNLTVKSYAPAELIETEAYQQFFEKWASEQNYYLVKDANFLKWRLGAEVEYKIYTLEDERQIKAVTISRVTELEKVKTLALLDIMALQESYKSLPFLFHQLKKIASSNNVELIATMISKYWAKKYNLVQSGFLPSPLKFTFISKLFNVSVPKEEFLNEKNWHLMWIDSDDL